MSVLFNVSLGQIQLTVESEKPRLVQVFRSVFFTWIVWYIWTRGNLRSVDKFSWHLTTRMISGVLIFTTRMISGVLICNVEFIDMMH